jgi:uncharacterized protein
MLKSEQIYRMAVHTEPSGVDAAAWNALLAQAPEPTPFLRHEYLAALHASGSAVADTGWAPCWITLHEGTELIAACAAYAKSHSYGEYVFDWAWAEAYRRHGLRYYPKLLAAPPFTPVPGSRLLARSASARAALARALREMAQAQRWSSAHVLFIDDADAQALQTEGWMLREGVQFHWQQNPDQPQADFSALLASMQRDKRKKIQQERRRVAEAGVTLAAWEGAAITPAHWDFFYRCYQNTYAEHHSTPYLTREFFAEVARSLPEHWLMFVAERGGQPIAASLVAIDRQRGTAWGRYWGADWGGNEQVPCLHFEACYYQPLAWCLSQGFKRFEGGAQGEHKMARGLLPVRTRSAHWLRDSRFAEAVADFLSREGPGIESYLGELAAHSPFKREP